MSARVQILTPAEEDVIIHSKLFNDERPLRRTLKKIVQLQTPPPPPPPPAPSSPSAAAVAEEGEDVDMTAVAPAAAAEEVTESEESIAARKVAIQEEVWESFNGQLKEVEFLVRKAGVVGKMENKMREEYESKGREIDDGQLKLREEIANLRVKLQLAEEERKHKMEYDAIALKILAVGSRATLESDIATLSSRVSTLQVENSSVVSTLQARKSRFDNLVDELEAIRKIGTEEAPPVVEEEEDEPKEESAQPSRVGSPAAEEEEGESSKAAEDDDEEGGGRREEKKVVATPKKKVVEQEEEVHEEEEHEAEGEVAGLVGDVEMQDAEEMEAEGLLVSQDLTTNASSSSKPSSSANPPPPPPISNHSSPLSQTSLSPVPEPESAPASPSKRKASKTPSSTSTSTSNNPLPSPTRRSSTSSSTTSKPAATASTSTSTFTEIPADVLADMSRSQQRAYQVQLAAFQRSQTQSQPQPSSSKPNKRARISNSPPLASTSTPANRPSRAKAGASSSSRQASGTPAPPPTVVEEPSAVASSSKGGKAAAGAGKLSKRELAKAGGKKAVAVAKKVVVQEESEQEEDRHPLPFHFPHISTKPSSRLLSISTILSYPSNSYQAQDRMETSVPMGPPLQLELSKHALGPFALGSTIFTVLDYLRTAGKDSFPWVQIKFDPESPATSPIHIHLLPLPGTLLIFPSPSQRLTQIHVLSLPSPNLTLVYSTQVLASPAKPLTRGDVSRVFGPTFDGGESGEIWYPGLGFGFDESSSSSGGGKDRSQAVRRVHICQKEEMGSSVEMVKAKQQGDGLVKAVIQPTRRSLQLHFLSSPPLSITLNETTVSDLLAELGPPIRTFYKEDTRMAIHSDDAKALAEEEGSYFQNYVQYGIDFLISGRFHKVYKIILHSNLPGAIQFGRYERCPWEFEGDERSDPPSPPLSVTTKASLLLVSLSTTTTNPSSSTSDWSSTVLRALTNPPVPANPSSLPLPTSPSPSPSPPPGTSEKKKKNSKREQPSSQSTPSSLSVPTSAATPAIAAAPRGREGGTTGTGGLDVMKGMVLDRAGEGWGKGVMLETTKLVAATENLAFEVLGGGSGGSGGDVETVMMF